MDSSSVYGYSDILSKETAVGLIMALGNRHNASLMYVILYTYIIQSGMCSLYIIGNTGSSLHRSSYYDTKLYFSHDGGFSWQEVMTVCCTKIKLFACIYNS